MNHEIRLTPIRLVDQDNNQVGIVETRDAMRMAEEAGLDLVEVQANVRPPLCKIMDYGKYKYDLSKKQRNSAGKQQELKQVRLGRSAKIDPHDVEIRVNQARRFIMDGHKVQFEQRFRGREMAHQDIGRKRLTQIIEDLADISKVDSPVRASGRQMTLVLSPDKPKIEAVKRKLAKEAEASGKSAEQVQAELDEKLKKQAEELDARDQSDEGDDQDDEQVETPTESASRD